MRFDEKLASASPERAGEAGQVRFLAPIGCPCGTQTDNSLSEFIGLQHIARRQVVGLGYGGHSKLTHSAAVIDPRLFENRRQDGLRLGGLDAVMGGAWLTGTRGYPAGIGGRGTGAAGVGCRKFGRRCECENCGSVGDAVCVQPNGTGFAFSRKKTFLRNIFASTPFAFLLLRFCSSQEAVVLGVGNRFLRELRAEA